MNVARLVLFFGLSLLATIGARAERHSLRTYTSAQGLARDYVNHIVEDSSGYVWLSTAEGLSRFDGYQFRNYGVAQGLPDRVVKQLVQTRQGDYWVATGKGLCRYNPSALALVANQSRRFGVLTPNDDARASYFNVLLEGHSGTIWCGTRAGLFRLSDTPGSVLFDPVDLGMPAQEFDSSVIFALVEDRQHTVWVGSGSGIYRLWPNGPVEHFQGESGLPGHYIHALLEDHSGRIWAGTNLGLCRLVQQPSQGSQLVDRCYQLGADPAGNHILALLESSDGTLWVGTRGGGLFAMSAGLLPEADPVWRRYTTREGLTDNSINTLAEDRYGNLWVGTENGGAVVFARTGIVTFSAEDGLQAGATTALLRMPDGSVGVQTRSRQNLFLHSWDGRRFLAHRLRLPKTLTGLGRGIQQTMLFDCEGACWVATSEGLVRFRATRTATRLADSRPEALYERRHGMPGVDVYRIYEDGNGDIWVSTLYSDKTALSRWERKSGRFYLYPEVPVGPQSPPTAFRQDREGNLWIGFQDGGLSRYRAGRFEFFKAGNGLGEGQIATIYLDAVGRLWIATNRGGVSLLKNPSADIPNFQSFTTQQELSSNDVRCITQDGHGRLFFGTSRGLDELDEAAGQFRSLFPSALEAPLAPVNLVICDGEGAVWFATPRGVSRVRREGHHSLPIPRPLITSLRVSGVPYPISDLGENQIAGVELQASQNHVQVDFLALGFSPAESLRYRFQLEGSRLAEGDTTALRSVNLASLAPGRYRFLVGAITPEKSADMDMASVSFTIHPPFWRQWWFLLCFGVMIGTAGYSGYRYRLNRLLEVERVRTRIATDLHDDIGSSLSQISILSEVIRQRSGSEDATSSEALGRIGTLSGELLDSMNDIVWSVNPSKDYLSELVQRMRWFAQDLLERSSVRLELSSPALESDLRLDPELRRHIFLIFKEAIHNALRHSRCTQINVKLVLTGGGLQLQIHDNGSGFDIVCQERGNGLANMQRRASAIGACFEIDSRIGGGTLLSLTVPWGAHQRLYSAFRRSISDQESGRDGGLPRA